MLVFHFYTPRTVVCHGFLFYLFILNFDLLVLKKKKKKKGCMEGCDC